MVTKLLMLSCSEGTSVHCGWDVDSVMQSNLYLQLVTVPTLSCDERLHCTSGRMRVQSMSEVASSAYIIVIIKAWHTTCDQTSGSISCIHVQGAQPDKNNK